MVSQSDSGVHQNIFGLDIECLLGMDMKFSFWTGWFTWWQMNSNISLKVCSSFWRTSPLVSSKFTSVKSIPTDLGIIFSKSLYVKSKLSPFPSSVPVDKNSDESTPSISNEIQYLVLPALWLKWFWISDWIMSILSGWQTDDSKTRTLFSFMSYTSSGSNDLIPK